MNNQIVDLAANNIRILSAAMVEQAKSGHPGGAMGGADYINILYSEFLNYDPNDMTYPHRDRFFLDPGHMSPMLYSVLALAGNFSMEELRNFRQWGSVTPGHPEVDVLRGVENTSGPLGQGHVMAVGAAIAERFLVERFGEWMSHKTYTFISDGGIQEEISQGAGRIAGFLGLSNLIMYYDSNNIQLSTKVEEVSNEDVAKKYEAWGWRVISIDGNSAAEIRNALQMANSEKERPVLIIGTTIMGKGCVDIDDNSYENRTSTHGQPISAAGANFVKTIKNLGGDPENPFQIFAEVEELYASRRKVLQRWSETKREEENAWADKHPDLAAKLEKFLTGELPAIDFSSIQQKANDSTRSASGAVLSVFADEVENMIVASADLANSDKTDGFLKKTTAFQKGDFSGAFLQAGVCELTMAVIMNGMALHGGVIPVCATFFVFSDYMKPAVRLAALMELPVKYVWTHDSFRVGEDGPTHQPVEHEAQIRLMEKLKNHSGQNSVLVLRPADAIEASVAWKMALYNTQTPTALLLSRQNIIDLPAKSNRFEEAVQAEKGGYIVKDSTEAPQLVLLASGSEVSTLVQAGDLLEKEHGMKVRVISIPSEGLFRSQPKAYQEHLLPKTAVRVGLTAGLPVALESLVGEDGMVLGLEHFGYSAKAEVLDEKFGFTPQLVVEKVVAHVTTLNKQFISQEA
ncbi:transketolase family protein [Carboxylicivirga taeanensis]|uniref:transketolase family protein n=1 Tax=Carboxylicivirga taeanensis TaxID=1416875 RepID=UPI003F6DC79E